MPGLGCRWGTSKTIVALYRAYLLPHDPTIPKVAGAAYTLVGGRLTRHSPYSGFRCGLNGWACTDPAVSARAQYASALYLPAVPTVLCPVAGTRSGPAATPAAPHVLDLERRIDRVGIRPLQSADGYLWIGTSNGLFRFEGLTFERYRPDTGTLKVDGVSALFAASDGGLWIGYVFGGVSFLKNGRLTSYAPVTLRSQEGLPGSRSTFSQTPDGTIWVAAVQGLARLEHGRWLRVGWDWQDSGNQIQSILVDRDGNFWVAAYRDVQFLPRGGTHFQPAAARGAFVRSISQATDCTIGAPTMVSSCRLFGSLGETIVDLFRESKSPDSGACSIVTVVWASEGSALRAPPLRCPSRVLELIKP